jgi:hypothetical protein
MKIFLFALAFVFAVIGGAAVAAPSDGAWEVRLPPTGAGRCVRDWIVRLTVAQGQLSGVFQGRGGQFGAFGTQTIEKLVLKPDESFTGTTSGYSSSHLGGYSSLVTFLVSGQFSGNTVSIAITGVTVPDCGTRTGKGTRTGG